MNTHPPTGEAFGIDPLLGQPTARGSVEQSELSAHRIAPDPTRRRGGRRSPRRQHPSRGARAVALAASVVATGAVAGALAYSEGAFSAESDGAANGSADQQNSSPAVVDGSGAPTSTIAADTATSLTPSTSAASTTTPETTQPPELGVEPSGYADGAYLGTAEYTEWGDVQVQVTISDGAIIDIAAVQFPTDRKSSSINDRAVPMLEAEAVALQNADLDIVSGATYTSRTYADSLQAALDQAASAATQQGATA